MLDSYYIKLNTFHVKVYPLPNDLHASEIKLNVLVEATSFRLNCGPSAMVRRIFFVPKNLAQLSFHFFTSAAQISVVVLKKIIF